jgi:eukaryotic-like serine/threonine-protein kinase
VQADGKVLAGGSGNGGTELVRLRGGNNCVVPSLRGTTVAKARAALRTAYCGFGRLSRQFSTAVGRGRVISTAPLVGGRLPGGTKVALVVSKGSRT